MKKISQEIPELPPRIIKAIDDNKFAIFIGAGISRLADCISWRTLAENYIALCLEHKLINYKEKETLEAYQDNRKIITIVYEKLRIKFEKEFYNLMRDALKGNNSKKEIFSDIRKLRSLIVTTNADKLLDGYFVPERIIYNSFGNELSLDKNKLYKIHGTIDEKESLIFTLPQYFRTYQDPNFNKFLYELFNGYNILFIGYGLAEFELLEFLFSKGTNDAKKEMRHFILLDFFDGEEAKLELERLYYNHLGIEIIPYSKNINGYKEQELIFKEWVKTVSSTTSVIASELTEIDIYINNPTLENINKTMYLIDYRHTKNNQAYDYFWQTIPTRDVKGIFLDTLNKKGYFNPNDIPTQYEEPLGSGKYFIKQWPVLFYLKTLVTSPNASNIIVNNVIKIVDKIIIHVSKEFHLNQKSNRFVDWILSDIIFYLPLNKIKKNHLRFVKEVALVTDKSMISHSLEDFVIKRVLPSNNKKIFVDIIELIFTVAKSEQEKAMAVGLIENYNLKNIGKSISNNLNSFRTTYLADYLFNRIKKAYKNSSPYSFSPYNINTIEENPQNSLDDKFEYPLIRLLRDVLIAMPKSKLIIYINKELLPAKEKIFKRILFYLINVRYKDFKSILWNLTSNPLDIIEVKHELYELFKANCINFNSHESIILLEWINSVKYPKGKNVTKEKYLLYTAFLKKEWLSSIENEKYIDINKVNLFKVRLNEIVSEEVRHPGYYTYSSFSSGIMSPLIKDSIWVESNLKITNFILSHQSGKEYNEHALVNELKRVIQDNPRKRSSTVSEFKELPINYKSEIVYAFYDLIKQTVDIDIEAIVEFSNETILEDSFWDITNRHQNWFLNSFCWFAKEILKNESFSINDSLLKKIETITLNALRNSNSNYKNVNNDFILDVINSTKGKLYETWLEINLRNGRQSAEKKHNKWLKKSFILLNSIVNSDKREVEFYYISNAYLTNFLYLNKKWFTDNFDLIYPKKENDFWKYGFPSYLYFTGLVYQNIYELFKNKKYFDYAITYYVDSDHTTDKLIQQIVVMYNSDFENIDDEDSLISKVILNRNPVHYNYVISFYLHSHQKSNKIIPLWKKILENSKEFSVESKQSLFNNLLNWLDVIPVIDDQIVAWCKLCIDNLKDKIDFRIMSIISARSDEALEQLGKIYYYILEKNKEVYYINKEKVAFIEKLYVNNLKELANSICRLSLERGDFSVKELHKKYNP